MVMPLHMVTLSITAVTLLYHTSHALGHVSMLSYTVRHVIILYLSLITCSKDTWIYSLLYPIALHYPA